MKRLEVILSGFVQGVSYRSFVKKTARKLGILGTVENIPNDSVHVVAEGEENLLRSFLAEIKSGYRFAHIEHVEEKWSEATARFSDFDIIR